MPAAGLFLGHTESEWDIEGETEGMCCACQEGYEYVCVRGCDPAYVSVNMGQYKYYYSYCSNTATTDSNINNRVPQEWVLKRSILALIVFWMGFSSFAWNKVCLWSMAQNTLENNPVMNFETFMRLKKGDY